MSFTATIRLGDTETDRVMIWVQAGIGLHRNDPIRGY